MSEAVESAKVKKNFLRFLRIRQTVSESHKTFPLLAHCQKAYVVVCDEVGEGEGERVSALCVNRFA